jgi:hypothetical protein
LPSGPSSNQIAPASIGPASAAQQANLPSGGQGSNAGTGGSMLPFTSSARRHREQMALSNATNSVANAVIIPEQAIPAYGFIRGLWIRVVATGGTGTTVTAAADGPFNFLGALSVTDPDGAPIYFINSGYTGYIIHKYGGYVNGASIADPKLDNFFSNVASATGNFQFQLYIPLEIARRNALAALPNTDSGKQYKLNISTNVGTAVYGTAPTTYPTATISVYLDAWTQPPTQDVLGRGLTRVPPLVGTTQYWSRQSIPVNAGQSNGQTFGRVGNIVRGWIFIFRNASGVRQAAANWMQSTTVYRDGYNYDVIDINNWLTQIAYEFGYNTGTFDGAGGPDTGVYPYMFIFDLHGGPGNELRGQYWPTLQSSRVELDGSYGVAGTLEVITNDIAPTGDLANRVTF